MTPTPRKVRSGRRQFGPSPGTEQEWEKVMQSPHVQRAFADPAIQQALMQHMQQQAAAAQPAPGMAQGGALHFDEGGSVATDIQETMRQINELPEGEKKNNLRMHLATLQAKQSQNSMGALALPGGGSASMSGLNEMVKPPTMGNTALAAGMGALVGAGNTSSPVKGALLGAGLSGALSYLIRKYGKGAQKPGDTSGGGGYGGGSGSVAEPNVSPSAPGSTAAPAASVTIPAPGPPGATPPGGGGRLMMGTGNSDSGNVISRDGGKTWVDSQASDKPYTGVVLNQSQVDPGSSLNAATPATMPAPTDAPAPVNTPPPDWGMGQAAFDKQQERLNHGLIRRGPAAGVSVPDAPPDVADLPTRSTDLDPSFYNLGSFGGADDGMAEGGPVEQEPQGLKSALLHPPVPVLHTTIVIAGKPKKDQKTVKKAGGGAYPKTQLLPPKRGPQDHEDYPRPHGRVQVPRGSGAAIKGKRFGGIY